MIYNIFRQKEEQIEFIGYGNIFIIYNNVSVNLRNENLKLLGEK